MFPEGEKKTISSGLMFQDHGLEASKTAHINII